MENKCPYCGHEMPKSSAYCLHCMRSLHEKDYVPQAVRGRKKSTLLVSVIIAALVLGGSIAVAAVTRRQPAPVAADVPVTESSAAPETTETTQPSTEQTTQPTTAPASAAQTTTQPPATTAQQPAVQTAPPVTKAPATTAANRVIISGGVLTDYPNTLTNSSYSIPYSVSSISKNAFHGNAHLRSLTFSKRTNLSCDWSNLFANLPNLEKIYIYTGTSADTQGMQYFDGEIIYYYD